MNKPKCKLIKGNENIFNLLAIASSCLKTNKMEGKAAEMLYKVFKTKSYNEAIFVIKQYVELY